jgi:hypothetical protein
MKALLMYSDRDFEWQAELPSQAGDLIQDLGLDVLFRAMAGDDRYFLEVARRGVLCGLTEPEQVIYRQQAWTDCLNNADAVRAMYDLTVDTLAAKKKIFGWFSQWSPDTNLRYAVQLMELLVQALRALRQAAIQNLEAFESPAFRRFFQMLADELDDGYFAEIDDHLQRLKFRRGVFLSARLGKGNAAVDIVLRRPPNEKQHWTELILGPRDGRLWFELHPRDDAGHHALEELRGRGLNLVADALSQSADHVLSFLSQLRAELAFYLACLNLWASLDGRGGHSCLPAPRPRCETRLSARGLYDICLALAVEDQVVDNDLAADERRLVIVTGANQGGKSTFLRAVGLAQLLMQAGMFVPAEEFTANVASGVFTHFKREEDATMTRGKLDEELARMSQIVDRVRPGGLVLCNESFASTNEREGSDVGEDVIKALTEAGVKVLIVTHLHDLAERFHREAGSGTLFLSAERLPDGRRTFKVREGQPLPTSFGRDVYERIFRDDPRHRSD